MGNPSSFKLFKTVSRALAAVAVAGSAMVLAGSGQAAQAPIRVQSRSLVTNFEVPKGFPASSTWRMRTTTLNHARLNLQALQQQSLSGQTIPFWTSQITSPLDGHTYTTSMVGTNPFTTTTVTQIRYVPIIVVYRFPDGTVFDPTGPACGDTQSVAYRFFNSPIFQPLHLVSNGIDVSVGAVNGTQLISAFQRANFWQYTHGSNYNVTLQGAQSPQVVYLNAPRGSSVGKAFGYLPCGSANKPLKLGFIDINAFDLQMQNVIAQYARPNQLPILLTYDVVTFLGNQCCFIGYHNAVAVPGGTQTYAVGSYSDTGLFGGLQDVSVWAHEIGEWMDDPFVQANVPGGGMDDLTPPWGNTGQVGSMCQNNLEVGDPLTGSLFALPPPGYGNFTYHTQDLAFEDWFYRTPAKGTGANYSMFGLFTSPAAPCPPPP